MGGQRSLEFDATFNYQILSNLKFLQANYLGKIREESHSTQGRSVSPKGQCDGITLTSHSQIRVKPNLRVNFQNIIMSYSGEYEVTN